MAGGSPPDHMTKDLDRCDGIISRVSAFPMMKRRSFDRRALLFRDIYTFGLGEMRSTSESFFHWNPTGRVPNVDRTGAVFPLFAIEI